MNHVVTAGVVGLFLILCAVIANRRLRHTEQCLIPSAKATPSTFFEIIVESLLGLMKGVLGDKAQKYFPLIGALFIYIFTCNIVGLIPGLAPPTDNINTNAACALLVFLYYNYLGIKEHGAKNYLKNFMGPLAGDWKFILITILFVCLELISHCLRPFTLTLRLFGNMTGDHLVLERFSELVPLLIPIIFLGLGLFIALMQAFVFSLLTIVYIGLAIEKSH